MRHQLFRVFRAQARHLALTLLCVGLAIAMLAPISGLTQAAPAAQGNNTLRVGYLGMADSAPAKGARLAINQINAIGGVTASDGVTYTLELLSMPFPPTVDNIGDAVAEFTNQGAVAILGPDDNRLITSATLAALTSSSVPILSGATNDSLTDAAASIFRTRAPERAYSYALATYLTSDLGYSAIALVQTDVASTEALLSFESTVLQDAGYAPTLKIQLPNGSDVAAQVQRLVDAAPQAIVLWGTPEDAVTLLRGLRDAGWTGQFAYRHAGELVAMGLLTDDETAGMLGADSFSFATTTAATRNMLRDYVTTFGRVPTPLATASYDAMWFLRGVIRKWGTSPSDVQAGLLGGAPQTLVQGTLHPIEFGNGDLARLTVVYQITEYGGQSVVARFDDVSRLPLGDEPPAPEETPVPQATATLSPLETPFPTATLQGAWVRVNVNVLNVRSGPSFNYDKLGQVNQGEQYRILGAIPDFSWLLVDIPGISGNVGWMKTEYVDVVGDLSSVSIVAPPASPTPAATITPTLAPIPDIVIDSAALSPTQPVPGKPFTLTVTVRNAGGGAAGRFAVAITLQPGNVYVSGFVDGLAGGQTTQVQMQGTLTGTGVYTEAIVADLNKEVAEGNEDNNIYNLNYRVDYPLLAQQANFQLNPGTNWDLYGGVNDIVWDGFNLGMLNGTTIGLIGGTYENAHYDMLQPGLINNGTGLTTDKVLVGSVYGLYLSETQRAVMRIDNRQNDVIWISYRVYNSNP